MDIVINKLQAQALVEAHRIRHIENYEEGMTGWKEAMTKYNEDMQKWAQDGGLTLDRPKEPKQPRNYLKDYDLLIEKLGYHQPATITVNDYEFEQIVRDKFNWTGNFLSLNSTYTGQAYEEPDDY